MDRMFRIYLYDEGGRMVTYADFRREFSLRAIAFRDMWCARHAGHYTATRELELED